MNNVSLFDVSSTYTDIAWDQPTIPVLAAVCRVLAPPINYDAHLSECYRNTADTRHISLVTSLLESDLPDLTVHAARPLCPDSPHRSLIDPGPQVRLSRTEPAW